jgi:hypothetical protein
MSVQNPAIQNINLNLALVNRRRAFTESKGASLAQIAIARVLSRGADMVPLVGPGAATGFARHSRHSTSNTPATIRSVSSGIARRVRCRWRRPQTRKILPSNE